MILLYVAIAVFLINLPFGYWRSKVKKFSVQWFLAIHVPVPVVYIIRSYAGVGWHLTTFPVLVGSFFLGQFIGNRYLKAE